MHDKSDYEDKMTTNIHTAQLLTGTTVFPLAEILKNIITIITTNNMYVPFFQLMNDTVELLYFCFYF